MDDDKLSGLVEERDALQAALAETHNERAALQQQLRVMREALTNLRNEVVATEEHGDGAADDSCSICRAIEKADKALDDVEKKEKKDV